MSNSFIINLQAKTMNKLFTKIPYGWPLMKDAFLDFASYSISQDEVREQFKKDIGYDLHSIIPKNGLEEMIDKATGRTSDILWQFMDWLIVNQWGEAEGGIPTSE